MTILSTRATRALFAACTIALIGACASTTNKSVVTATPSNAAVTPARNVILFIGDGMGVTTVTAARIYDGQSRGESGEENYLSFEKFPNLALVKTYNTDSQVPDSAGTATAMNSGVKTRAGVIGVGPDSHRGDCAASQSQHLPSIAKQASSKGMAVGIVSTARITHATPAAVYAHSPDRNWENDGVIPNAEQGKGCVDIAQQLVEFPFSIALGGGRGSFFGADNGGVRRDAAANLPAQWASKTGGKYVDNQQALQQAIGTDKPVLGLFSLSHMTYTLDRTAQSVEPTLSEMTDAAINHLAAQNKPYYLMIEAGRIDHGHHGSRAGYALTEAQELSRAVKLALSKVDLSNTLILVTADHSHVFTMAGYPTRGNPILGLVVGNDARGNPETEPSLAMDGKPYATLGYANGPGAVGGAERPIPQTGERAVQQSLMPMGDEGSQSETHGGEDVPLYAIGPGSEYVRGVIDQDQIYHLMIKALAW